MSNILVLVSVLFSMNAVAINCNNNDGGSSQITKLNKYAKDGYSEAEMLIGTMYLEGKVVDLDQKKSFFWLEKTSRYNFTNGAAAHSLGLSYFYGQGTKKNLKMVYVIWRKLLLVFHLLS